MLTTVLGASRKMQKRDLKQAQTRNSSPLSEDTVLERSQDTKLPGWLIKMLACIGVLLVTLFFCAIQAQTEAVSDEQGIFSPDPLTVSALREFEQRIGRMYLQQSAHAHAQEQIAEPSAVEAIQEAESSADSLRRQDTPRLRFRKLLDRMAVSTGWQVEQDSWRAGIRLRYSRAVEFDAETNSYALMEASEIAPSVGFRIVTVGRPMKVIVRRTGYETWDKALFTPPSRWLFADRPNQIQEAQQLAPGTEITMSNEAKFFIGPNVSVNAGSFPLRAYAGAFVSGEYFVRLKRLARDAVEAPGNQEWFLSVGGLIPHGFESGLTVRTPEIALGKRLRVLHARWRLPTGARFLLRAGPVDLGEDSEMQTFFRAIVGGAAIFRLSDLRLLGPNIKVAVSRPEIGLDLLQHLEKLSHFRRVLEVVRKDEDAIPYSESISRYSPRGHGEFGTGLWALVYGFEYDSDWYAEESLGVRPDMPPHRIYAFPHQRRWDRGWLFFPRETHDLQMVTVQDAQDGSLFTEVSLEIEDAHAHEKEGKAYRAQIMSFLTQKVMEKFPMWIDVPPPDGPKAIRDQLPDLLHSPGEDEKVSIYLRLILGPRFHEQLRLAEAKDEKERRDMITEWQKEVSKTIRRGGNSLEKLVSTYGTEDLYVGFRIALTPYARRKESPRPTTVFTGTFGDPDKITSYRRLRDTFDDVGTIF